VGTGLGLICGGRAGVAMGAVGLAAAGGEDRWSDTPVHLEWLLLATDRSGDGVCLLRPIRDPNGVTDFSFLYINSAGAAMNGMDRQTHTGRTVRELFPAMVGNDLFQRYVEVIETGASYVVKAMRHHEVFGGGERRRAFDVQAVKADDALLVIWRDVTDCADVFDQLRHSQTIIQASPNAIITHRTDGMITGWNPAAELAYGYSAAEVVGRPTAILQPPDRAGEFDDLMARVSRGQQIKEFDTVRVAKDGTDIATALTVIPAGYERGKVVAVVTIAIDVTARRSAEAALRASQAYNRGLIEAAPDGLITVDHELIITDVNKGMCRLAGHPRSDLIGTKFGSHFLQPDRAEEAVRTTLEHGVVHNYELTTVHGARKLVSLDAATYIDPQSGQVAGIFASVRDITATRQAEQEVLRLNERSRDEALAASAAKSEFLATMSHEIRTPMNGVIGLTELLLRTSLDDAQHRYAHGIQAASSSLLAIISDVLDISKVEAGRLELSAVDLVLADIVEDVVDVVSDRARAKSIAVASFVSPDLPEPLVGDPVRIRQILLNLVDNAVKFTDHGGVSVLARPATAQPGDPNLFAVELQVIDTGVGISDDDLKRLFRRFNQALPIPERPSSGGTGLGLSISRQLVTLMGGGIGVESKPGRGSVFSATINLARSQTPVASPAEPDLAGQGVLIVEPSSITADAMTRYLTRWGLASDVVGTAEQALQHMRDHQLDQPYQLLIIDESMFGSAADELAVNLPSPTILLSPTAPDHTEFRQGRAIIVLHLPVRRAQLMAGLRQALARTAPITPTPPGSEAEPAQPVETRPPPGRTALVVEDNELNQMVAVGMLNNLGYDVELAANGQEAVAKATAGEYAIIFMDVIMPVMDGYEATGRLRAHERQTGHGHTAIVAMTASARLEDRDRCLGAGMDDYIAKPFTPAQLADVLGKWSAPRHAE
jgi:PAS domain S-box-containing protein